MHFFDGKVQCDGLFNSAPLPRDRPQDRSAIPANILHQVHLRDRGACRKRMPDGSNCGQQKWIDIHHIIPKSYGGADAVENLMTLCKVHHRQLHERSA